MACIYLINNRGLVGTYNLDITLLSESPTSEESTCICCVSEKVTALKVSARFLPDPAAAAESGTLSRLLHCPGGLASLCLRLAAGEPSSSLRTTKLNLPRLTHHRGASHSTT